MSFLDSLKEFGEGAWESVSTGAQTALGAWASGGQTEAQAQAQAEAAATTAAPNTTTDQAQPDTANEKAYVFGLSKKEMAIGGGFLLIALIAVAKL